MAKNYDWKENSLTMALDDMVFDASSLTDTDDYCAKPSIVKSVTSIDALDALYKHYILSRDMARLNPQRKSLLRSLQSGEEIDYSFLSDGRFEKRLRTRK